MIDLPEEIWGAFKVTCAIKGIKLKEGIRDAVISFIEQNSIANTEFKAEIIKDSSKNLMNFVVESQVKDLLAKIMEGRQRKAPIGWDLKLKQQLFEIVKKYPYLSEETSREIKTVLQNLG